MEGRKIRVLIAKPGLDGHEAGAKVIARALRDAGMEVIYTGPRQTPEMIAEAAIEEDVNVLGLSVLSGAHKELTSRVMDGLKGRGVENVLVVVGGIIPKEDIPALERIGVRGVFGPGTDTRKVVEFIQTNVTL